MRPRTVLLLVVAAALLGSVLWFFERDVPSTEDREEQAGKVLALDPGEVTSIEIEGTSEPVRIERLAPSEWRVTSPLDARADEGAVEGLLSQLSELPRKRVLEDAAANEVGLESPRGWIVLKHGEEIVRLAIGGDVPASSDVVLGVGGEYVVTSAAFWEQADKPARDWRSRDMVPYSSDEILRLELRGSRSALVLERRGDGVWLLEPVEDVADRQQATRLMEGLAALEATSFVDADQSVSDPEGNAFDLELVIAGRDEALSVRLAPAPVDEAEVIGVADGVAFRAKTDLLEILALEPRAWQSMAWTELEAYDFEAIDVVAGEETLHLSRTGGDWVRDGTAVPYSIVSDFIYAITDLRGTAVSKGDSMSASPLLEVVVTTKAGETVRLALVDGGSGTYLAESTGREYRPVVSQEDVDSFLGKLAVLRDADPVASYDGA